MSMAIKYSMMKKAKKNGAALCDEHGAPGCEMCHGGGMADGGDVEMTPDERKRLAIAGFKKAFKTPSEKDGDEMAGYAEGGDVEPMHNYAHESDDMVDMIMRKRFSKGGQVANDVGSGQEADKLPNQYDDLVLRDGLEQHYTGANSGDELGNAQKDEDERDMIAQIMKSRAKKDRLPNPR